MTRPHDSETIGFIGLGIMGAPMVSRLLDAGFEVATVLHRRPLSSELEHKGMTVLPTAAEAASVSDIVITMLPNTPEVESVLFARGGVVEGIRPGSLVIDMTSISPSHTVEFAQRIRALDCEYLDAPVSGGEVGAKSGSLTVMAGARPVHSSAPSRYSARLGRT